MCLLLLAGVLGTVIRGIARPLAALHRWALAEPGSGQAPRATGCDEFAAVARRITTLAQETRSLRGRLQDLGTARATASAAHAALAAEHQAVLRSRAELLRTRDDLMRSREELAARLGEVLARSSVHAAHVNLSLRTLGLVERQLVLIEELEEHEQEPGRLADLFRLDHFAARMRRNSENLLVLTGTEHSHGASARPVPLIDVARAAMSEAERYDRVRITSVPEARVAGRAADDVSHLVAELLDNASAFSAATADIHLAGWVLDSGEVALSVEDSGIGLSMERAAELNVMLADPDPAPPGGAAGIGLYVVSRLAHRHGVRVELRPQPTGGTLAVVVLPQVLVLHLDPLTSVAPAPGDASSAPERLQEAAWQQAPGLPPSHLAARLPGQGRVEDQLPPPAPFQAPASSPVAPSTLWQAYPAVPAEPAPADPAPPSAPVARSRPGTPNRCPRGRDGGPAESDRPRGARRVRRPRCARRPRRARRARAGAAGAGRAAAPGAPGHRDARRPPRGGRVASRRPGGRERPAPPTGGPPEGIGRGTPRRGAGGPRRGRAPRAAPRCGQGRRLARAGRGRTRAARLTRAARARRDRVLAGAVRRAGARRPAPAGHRARPGPGPGPVPSPGPGAAAGTRPGPTVGRGTDVGNGAGRGARRPAPGDDPSRRHRRGGEPLNAASTHSSVLSSEASGLQWLLEDFVEEVPGVRSVAVVSSDGLPLLSSQPDPVPARDPAGQGDGPRMDLAAVVSGLASLTVGAARLMDGGAVRQTTVAMDGGVLAVMSISDGSLLGVHAAADCDLSVVAYNMARFVGRAGHALTPAIRGELRNAMENGTVTPERGR